MKTALFTAGLPRFTESFYKLQDQILGSDNYDLYFAFWRTSIFPSEEECYKKIKKFITNTKFKIKKIILIEEPKIETSKYTNMYKKTKIPNVMLMWYGLEKVFEIIDNSYDCYIRFRLDGKLDRPIDLKSIDLFQNICTPFKPTYGYNLQKINDQFAIGNYDNMKHYCNLYSNFDLYYDHGIPLHPETYLSYHLAKKNGFSFINFKHLLKQDKDLEV